MIILTDLSEVLIRGVYGIEDLVEDQYGEKIAERFARRRLECDPFFIELMRSHLAEDQYWEIVLHGFDWPFGVEDVELMCSFNFALGLQQSAIGVYKRIVEYPESAMMDSLRHRGCPEFWIVSDHIPERKDEIKAMHPKVFQFASRVIWSYDYGLVKSDVGFFEQLLRRNKLEYYDVLFIDDVSQNIWSAAKANIAGIKYEGPDQLETQLRSLGFRFSTTSSGAH